MKKIRILSVSFDLILPFDKLPQFRGAIINLSGGDHVLFHNHIDDEHLRYQYPLIQYKLINRKASVISIDEGTDEIPALFANKQLEARIDGEPVTFVLEDLHARQWTIGIWNTDFYYSMQNWLGLNENNYSLYQKSETLEERCLLLERVLTGNILSLAKGLNYFFEQPVVVKILKVKRENVKRYKGTLLSAFDLEFRTNVSLPDYISLGKGASLGFGAIRHMKEKEENKNEEQYSDLN